MKIKLRKRIKTRLIVQPPRWFRRFSGPIIWRADTDEKVLYLTFDDGPVPELTPWILDQLDAYDVKATFFCVGDNVRKYPELYQEIIKRGHGIGNHSYSHKNGFRTSIRTYVKDVYRARRYINSKVFRPPYGRLRVWARRLLKARYHIVLWDVLSMDYDQTLDPRQVVRNVIGHADAGSIIVFHDNVKAKTNLEYALPRILDYYSKRGYSFVDLQKDIETGKLNKK